MLVTKLLYCHEIFHYIIFIIKTGFTNDVYLLSGNHLKQLPTLDLIEQNYYILKIFLTWCLILLSVAVYWVM